MSLDTRKPVCAISEKQMDRSAIVTDMYIPNKSLQEKIDDSSRWLYLHFSFLKPVEGFIPINTRYAAEGFIPYCYIPNVSIL